MSRRPAGGRISSGARAAPYARPAGPNRSASGSGSRMVSRDAWEADNFTSEPETQYAAPSPWPPATLNIRGASGPTWVIVGNLMLGTSAEDIEETFKQFGEIAEIKRREPPSPNHPSMSFNVAFNTREAALASIQSMDRVVADGRVISVSLAHGPVVSGPARLLNAAGVSRSDGPAPRVAGGAAIVQPLEAAKAVQAALPKRQAQGQQQQQQRQQVQHKASKPLQQQAKVQAPGGGVPVPVPSLSSRLLTAAELRALQKRQAREKAAAAAAQPAAGAKGSAKGAAAAQSNGKGPLAQAGSLSSRIGALPLALRLTEQKAPQSQLGAAGAKGKGKAKKGAGGAAMSDIAMPDTTSAKRKRSKQGKGKGAASGMDLD